MTTGSLAVTEEAFFSAAGHDLMQTGAAKARTCKGGVCFPQATPERVSTDGRISTVCLTAMDDTLSTAAARDSDERALEEFYLVKGGNVSSERLSTVLSSNANAPRWFCGVNFEKGCGQAFASYFANTSDCFVDLAIHSTHIPDEVVEGIATGIAARKEMGVSLDFRDSHLSQASIAKLAELLQDSNVQLLDLGKSNVTAEGTLALAEVLAHPGRRLQSLVVRKAPLSASGVEQRMQRALELNPALLVFASSVPVELGSHRAAAVMA